MTSIITRFTTRRRPGSEVRLAARAVLLATLLATLLDGSALAQSNPGWFVPSQTQGASGGPPAAAAPTRRQVSHREAPPPMPVPIQDPAEEQAAEQQAPQQQEPLPKLPEPPVPTVPAQPKGAAPPVAVVGVIGVPEIMRASTAAQEIERVIGERRNLLSQDAQRAQLTWREMQQALINDRGKLSGDQVRERERALQTRVTSDQKALRDRNRIIQETAQVALGQIERELVQVIRVVAEAHGMNLVLHRSQVALNVNEFDISPQVVDVLNKALPQVTITPDGVDPALQVSQAEPPKTAASKARAATAVR